MNWATPLASTEMAFKGIEHIVVLVMENRSFDHLLGYRYLDAPGGTPSTFECKTKANPNGTTIARSVLAAPRFIPGPSHEYEHVKVQLDTDANGQATMRGFVKDYETVFGVSETAAELVTHYYDREILPVYDYLADHYTVCNRWFCSVPGPTLPNRCFLLAGHSDGIVENTHLGVHLLTHHVETIFDHLSANGVSWRLYYHDVPSIRFFKQYTLSLHTTRTITQFDRDVDGGDLPQVTWIDPNFTIQGTGGLPDDGNDDHPPCDLRRGQMLVASIYNRLITSKYWQNTLFIVTYDEHGGFFDHVPPPVKPERAPFNNRLFDSYGVRVPTFLISPRVKAGLLSDQDYEHTSIARTILDCFCPWADVSAMGQRLAYAPSLADAIEQEVVPATPDKPVANLNVDDWTPFVVGGVSREKQLLGAVPSPDFHRLVKSLGAHVAKARRAPT